jgi:hypothetical protein
VIRVTLDAPVVKIMPDTSVNINDSLTVTATATDNGKVEKYAWAIDGGTYPDTTSNGSIKVAYSDSGRRIIRVKSFDDDGVWSDPDSCVIRVTLNAPVVTAKQDTTVSFAMTSTVDIKVIATDTNQSGSIAKYYWDIGADGWDDSTNVAFYTVSTDNGGIEKIRWAARDDDGIFSYDTFDVRFNRPPTSASLIAPTTNRDRKAFDYSTGKWLLSLSFSSIDPDGINDTPLFVLYCGPNAGLLTKQYMGNDSNYNLADVDSSAKVYYRLVAFDICRIACSCGSPQHLAFSIFDLYG